MRGLFDMEAWEALSLWRWKASYGPGETSHTEGNVEAVRWRRHLGRMNLLRLWFYLMVNYFRIKDSSASTRRPNVENQCNSTMFWTNLTF